MGRRAAVRVVASVAVLAAVFGGGWWAGQAVFRVPDSPASDAAGTFTATVIEASVGRTLTFSVTMSQPYTMVAANMLAGVVTNRASTSEVDVGDAVFEVGAVPVRVVVGAVPFYRDLRSGSQGTDVQQLQQALIAMGYLSGPADGDFGAATEAALKSWQQTIGIPQSGLVRLGELIAVPELPATVRLGEGLARGALVSGGEDALLVRSGSPTFTIELTPEQAGLIPPQASVRVRYGDQEWLGVISGRQTTATGQEVLSVTTPEGGAICGTVCSTLPPEETLSLAGVIEVVPPMTGPAVPVVAVRTDTSGSRYVQFPDGTRADVVVRGSSGGLAVLDGVSVGDEVVLSSAGSTPNSSDRPADTTRGVSENGTTENAGS